ncbi:sugar transferase [Thiohalobacter thiocyanaticus]|uniref:Sugar transferase n=1 Tax=Thiohalobacter thiocyanaticus TaxID=585455 RepID=A0A1Z4VSS6_9GAMM|nr:sugar transferase [Thiohalobacter thiocyanaticus]BAZ94543.1 sugar transferase [Thiohalobacter thiocyanaticus]
MALSRSQAMIKRGFDILGASLGLVFAWWLVVFAWLAATIDTRQNGFFTQSRIGRNGRLFRVIKIRTMRNVPGVDTTVTARGDPRITHLGRLLRKAKIDELPQLINVLRGDMSFVGPRPDVPGFADRLTGEDRIILSIRPGITGPATLKYRDEEAILAEHTDPDAYNRDVIFPDKVRLNREYIENWSLSGDIRYIWQTIAGR